MNQKIGRVILFLVILSGNVWLGRAQEHITEVGDSVVVSAPDSTVKAVLQRADSLPLPKVVEPFKPNPNKAVLFALVPGMGQLYNRKYWKLPLVYGGFMGFAYAITWNGKNYGDYSQAYKDVISDAEKVRNAQASGGTYTGPWGSWENFLPLGDDPATKVTETQFQDNLKRRKDYFRKYRDLSIILTGLWYGITIIDAYIDAQLFDFDISPDLSLRVEPVVSPKTSVSPGLYGVNCSIKF